MENYYNNLDDEWINNFDKIDNLYKDFYKDDIYYIHLRILYINRNNEIDKIKNERFLMTKPNNITREEIIGILKKKSIDDKKRYTLLSILKYNINLEPDEINNYVNKNYNNKYLTVIKNIDTITFEKSINMFHDLNDIIFIFYEKSSELIKKVSNNSSKKIYLNFNTKKKTIKKRYKD
jgi:hypothetical protein